MTDLQRILADLNRLHVETFALVRLHGDGGEGCDCRPCKLHQAILAAEYEAREAAKDDRKYAVRRWWLGLLLGWRCPTCCGTGRVPVDYRPAPQDCGYRLWRPTERQRCEGFELGGEG